MAEEVLVVLNRKDPTCGLGFSLLGTPPGFPPIIYEIVENSPAAESGKVETGDVLLKVNGTDVDRLNTKEVLKCLRLSENPVSLRLKRDPVVKARVRHYLSIPHQYRAEMSLPELISESAPPLEYYEQEPPPPLHPLPLEDVTRTNGNSVKEQPQPKFEAFVMTGDRVLKICRNQQGSALPNKHQRKVDTLRNHVNNHNNYQRHNSVPTSPTETERHKDKPSSAGTSPVPNTATPSSSYVVRTSRSEDHLQFNKDSLSAVSIDIDDDVTSSLNTLLDTRPDSEAEDQRIVWTYNAPLTDSSDSRSPSSDDNISPHRSVSPASPTSVSSSVMSSSNSSDSSDRPHRDSEARLQPHPHHHHQLHQQQQQQPPSTDLSQSEAVSNISSPDFQEEDSEIIARDLVMEVSDPSDSDSTLLVSETNKTPRCNNNSSHNGIKEIQGEHRIVIQVKGPDKQSDNHNRSNSPRGQPNRHTPSKSNREAELYNSDAQNAGYQTLHDDDDSLAQLTEGAANLAKSISPPSVGSEEDSDVDSLHSFHYSPKAVDMPSAERLAKRLFTLDGFKKSDVSRHLSKNNDFSRAVAEEYLKYFSFSGDTLDAALRKFLTQFSLTGETQERERVLVHFSKRYLESNPGIFSSQDAVHTLTCAIMLLNTDLHGQNLGRKMTCNEFIDNLSELNDGDNFPREILKTLYQAIKNHPLEWALDEEAEDPATAKAVSERENGSPVITAGKGGLFDVPSSAPAIEYKKGYVMRKCCVEPNGKKTPLGKRGWKMYYCTLRDLVLYLHKDEHGFRKTQLSDNLHNAIRIHHSLATKAADYTKKLHVFRLETADQAVYLFQTSDSKELQSWIDTINFVCASFSAQPLPGAVGSQKKFQRPLLPSSHTKLNLREQLRDHETLVQRLESELDGHRKHPPERGAKQLTLYNFREKDAYLQYEVRDDSLSISLYELKRYKTYAYLLRSRMSQLPDMIEGSLIESIGESAEESAGAGGGAGSGTGEERRGGGASPAVNSQRVRKQGTNSTR